MRARKSIKAIAAILSSAAVVALLLTIIPRNDPAHTQGFYDSVYKPYMRTFFQSDSLLWQQVGSNGLGDTDNDALSAAAVYENRLWIGTERAYPNGPGLYILDNLDGQRTKVFTNNVGVNDTFNVSTTEMFVYDGRLVIALTDTLGRGRLYQVRSFDSSMAVVDTNGRGDSANDSVTVMQEFNGDLYVAYWNATTTASGGAELWKTNDLSTFSVADTSGFVSAGVSENRGISAMAVWNGYLWAGTQNRRLAQMYRTTDGTNWTKAMSDSGMYNSASHPKSTSVDVLKPLGEYLYAAIGDSNGVRWYRTDARRDTAWVAITFLSDSGFGQSMSDNRIMSSTVYAGRLWVGTKSTRGAKVFYTYPDTNVFLPASGRGFSDTTNTSINFLAGYQGYLYAGTSNTSGGELWKLACGIYESDGYIKTDGGNIGDVTLDNGQAKAKGFWGELVSAIKGYFNSIITTSLTVRGTATIDSLNIATENIDTLWADVAKADSLRAITSKTDTAWVTHIIITRAVLDSGDITTETVDTSWVTHAIITRAAIDSIDAETGKIDTLWITNVMSGDSIKFTTAKGDTAWLSFLSATTISSPGTITGDSLRSATANIDTIWTTRINATGTVTADSGNLPTAKIDTVFAKAAEITGTLISSSTSLIDTVMFGAQDSTVKYIAGLTTLDWIFPFIKGTPGSKADSAAGVLGYASTDTARFYATKPLTGTVPFLILKNH